MSMRTPSEPSAGPRRRTRGEQAEANRTALLDAAFQAFATDGYASASLDRIAEQAGFSKGAVYSRFASKADLFLAVLERRIGQRAEDNLQKALATLEQGGDVIAELTELISTATGADAGWQLALVEFRVVAARDEALRARYAALHARSLSRIADLVAVVVERLGLEPPVPTPTLARTLFALDVGTTLEDAAAPRPIPLAERIEVVRSIVGQTPGEGGTT